MSAPDVAAIAGKIARLEPMHMMKMTAGGEQIKMRVKNVPVELCDAIVRILGAPPPPAPSHRITTIVFVGGPLCGWRFQVGGMGFAGQGVYNIGLRTVISAGAPVSLQIIDHSGCCML